jgi:RNA polymerase sigma-70 factor, ECF subfamily
VEREDMLVDQACRRSTLAERPPDTPAGDAELVTRISTGDQAAFRVLFDRYADAVFNHSLRLTGSVDAAEDIAAVVFLEAWRRRSDYRTVGNSAAPWLHGITYNVARNHWRSTRRYRSALARLRATRETDDPAAVVVERVAAEERLQRVLPAIRKLPKHQRQAIEVCVAGGVPYDEAGVLLGIPAGTLKSRVSRGLATLRSSIDNLQLQEEL